MTSNTIGTDLTIHRPSPQATGWHEIPSELLLNVLSYLPDMNTRKTVSGTCRHFRQICDEETERQIESHPFLHFLAHKSSLVQKTQPPAQKLPILDRYVKIAERCGLMAQTTLTVENHFPLDFEDPAQIREAHRNGIQTNPLDPQNPLRSLLRETQKVNFDGLSFAALFLEDSSVMKTIDMSILDPTTVDSMAFLSLLRGKVDLFNTMLPDTSIYGESFPPRISNAEQHRQAALETFLVLAAELNQEETFEKLLNLGKPYNANKVLEQLVKLNRPDFIPILFTSRGVIDHQYVSTNGTNQEFDHYRPGLHTALMEAANTNKRMAFDAILQARPGELIDRRILEHIRDLFQNDPDIDNVLGAQNLSPNLDIEGWRSRRARYNAPARAQIIQHLNNEIAQRYPNPNS